MQRIGFLIIVVVSTLGLMGGGGYLIWHQQTLLRDAKSVSGKILSLKQTGRGEVAVEYEYRRGFNTYTSNRLTPLPKGLGMLHVKSVLEQFEVEENTTVYISASNPSSSYLLARGYAYPYLFVLLGLGVGIVGWRIAGRMGMFDPPPFSGRTLRSGWHVLPRSATPTEALASRLIEAFLWIATSLFLLGHYFVTIPRPVDWTIAVLGVGLFWGIWPVVLAWRWITLATTMADTTLCTTLPKIHLDQPVIVRLKLPVMRSMAVHEVRIALTCWQHTLLDTQELFTCSSVTATGQTITPSRPWHSECRFEIPHKKRRVSSTFSRLDPPRINWRFELEVRLRCGRSYTMRFPVEACLTDADAATSKTPAAA